MSKTLKKFLSVLLVLAMMLALAGCGGQDDTATDDTASDDTAAEDTSSGEKFKVGWLSLIHISEPTRRS